MFAWKRTPNKPPAQKENGHLTEDEQRYCLDGGDPTKGLAPKIDYDRVALDLEAMESVLGGMQLSDASIKLTPHVAAAAALARIVAERRKDHGS